MLRTTLLLFAIGLLLVPGAGALAGESESGVYCGDLSAADCQILHDRQAAMDEVYGLSFGMRMDMTMTALSPGDVLQLNATGAGKVALSPEAASALLAADPADMSAQLAPLLTGFQGDISFSLTGESTGEALDMQLDLRMKDGVVLLGAAAMEALAGEAMTGLAWFGFDTGGAVDQVLELAGLDSALANDYETAAMEEAEASAKSIARLPDSQLNGAAVAVFETRLDVNQILSLMTLDSLLAMANPSQVDDAAAALSLAQSLEAREMSSREYIGLADSRTHRIELVMDMTIAGDFVDQPGMDTDLSLRMEMDLADFNQAFEVEIPEDAMVFPLAMMLQMQES